MRKRDGHFVNFCTLTPFFPMAGPLAHWLRMVSSAFSDIRNTLKGPVPPRVLASFCANFSHVLVINSGLMLFP